MTLNFHLQTTFGGVLCTQGDSMKL